MTLIAAVLPPTNLGADPDLQVVAEAEDIIVGVLFDDIVRALRPVATGRHPGRGRGPAPLRRANRTEAPPPATAYPEPKRWGWARSPPGRHDALRVWHRVRG
jgi:hypothetical protein